MKQEYLLYSHITFVSPFSSPSPQLSAASVCRGNQLGVAGWAAVTKALESVKFLASLNGCGQYAAIRAGRLAEMNLSGTELGVWAAQFLERSASILTTLDVR